MKKIAHYQQQAWFSFTVEVDLPDDIDVDDEDAVDELVNDQHSLADVAFDALDGAMRVLETAGYTDLVDLERCEHVPSFIELVDP